MLQARLGRWAWGRGSVIAAKQARMSILFWKMRRAPLVETLSLRYNREKFRQNPAVAVA